MRTYANEDLGTLAEYDPLTDQEERELDGSYHWNTVRPVLLKAFEKQGAQHFSEIFWFQLVVDHFKSFGLPSSN